jgi:lysophospholipase L1-like esterase
LLSKKLKIISWNIFVPILLLLLLEVLVRIALPEIQLQGLDRKILVDSVYFSSPGLRKNASGISNGVIKTVDINRFWQLNNSTTQNAMRKILFLGDSATMGIGVDNDSTFAGLLNSLFEDAIVFNSSLIGYSSEDYLNIARQLVLIESNKLGITDIFIFWCLNDVYSNFPDKKSPQYKPDLIRQLTGFLRGNSKLYHFIKKSFSDRSRDYFIYDRSFYEETNDKFKKSTKDLETIGSIAGSKNLRVYLFLLPYEYQLRNNSTPGIFAPQELLKKTLTDSLLTVTDIRNAFNTDEGEYKKYYLYGDGIHYSIEGHKRIASFLGKRFAN